MVSMGMKAILSSSILNSQVPERLSSLYLNWLWVIFGLAPFLPFFIFGVLCYDIFRRRAMGVKITVWTYVMLALIILAMLIPEKDVVTKLIYLLMVFCFLAFIYFPGKLSFFRNRYLCGIGFSSYFLYLIHEQLGVLLIYSFGQYFYPFMFVFPIILMVVLIFLSILFSEKIDKRIMTFLRKNWLQ
jgi:peptidoglycan/LPS O-acetylase OafA/YrhL